MFLCWLVGFVSLFLCGLCCFMFCLDAHMHTHMYTYTHAHAHTHTPGCPRLVEQELLENCFPHGVLDFARGFGAPVWPSRSCLKIVSPAGCSILLVALVPQCGRAGAA